MTNERLGFSEYYVGQKLESMVGESRPAYHVTNQGIMIFQPLYIPDEQEIKKIKGTKRFYLTHINGVVVLIIDFGGALKFEYDINPYLMDGIEIPDIADEMGMSIQFFLVNSANGEVAAIQFMGLNKAFSIALLKALKEEQNSGGSADEYLFRIYQMQRKYTIKQLIKFSQVRFSIEH